MWHKPRSDPLLPLHWLDEILTRPVRIEEELSKGQVIEFDMTIVTLQDRCQRSKYNVRIQRAEVSFEIEIISQSAGYPELGI